jgi:hypothetical protein
MDMFVSKRPAEVAAIGGKIKKLKNNGTGNLFKNQSVSTDTSMNDRNSKLKNDDTIKSKKQKVHFKFNQGFSNAVRRPVHISEFL